MQVPIETVLVRSLRPAFSIGLACALTAFATLAQAKVQPPPLPPGSSMVRIQAGMNDDEVKREKRAHHHKGHFRKDIHKDDSEADGKGNNDKGSKK